MTRTSRIGLAVYLYYNRDARKIQKYGDVHYHSRRLRYMIIYVDKAEADEVVAELKGLKFVKSVAPSQLDQINHQFVGNLHANEETIENKMN